MEDNLEDYKINKVNYVFLATVLVYIAASFIDFSAFISNRIILIVISQIIFVLPAAVFLYIEKIPYKEVVRLKKIRSINIILLILLAFLLSPILTFISSISMLFASNSTSSTMINVMSNNDFAISLICIAIIPAIFEESVYRGLYYNTYKKVSIIKAILLSALLFSLLHGNINQFSYTFVMGIILALVVEATDSILSGMIIHFMINAMSVVQVYLLPKIITLFEILYVDAMDRGDNNIMELIEESIGGTNFNYNEILEKGYEAIEKMTLMDVILSYGSSALIGGVLAFLVFRKISKSENRWEHIKSLFLKNKDQDSVTEINENGNNTKLINWTLIAAIILITVFMILVEIAYKY